MQGGEITLRIIFTLILLFRRRDMTKNNDGISTSHILGFLFCDIALIKQKPILLVQA